MMEEPRAGHYISSAPLIHAALLIALCMAAYLGTLHSPMLWDERAFLLDNPAIKDASYFLSPSNSAHEPYYPLLARRYVGLLSFALNWRLSGPQVEGYHALNIAVHAACALLVYIIARLLLGSASIGLNWGASERGRAALLAAMLFALHPAQTEAVTYIYQRFASMAAMFCLAGMALYAASARAHGGRARAALMAGALLSIALAMKTKENSFTFPLIIGLMDAAFLDGGARRRALRLAPMIALMAIVPYGAYMLPSASAQPSQEHYSALQYASAQPLVVARYLGLFLLPVGQSLEHDVSTYASPLDPMVAGPLALHAALVGLALYLIRQQGWVRMAGFGVLWFYLALAVESSFTPIPMLMDEYRMYLPVAGLCMGLAPLAVLGIGRLGGLQRSAAYAAAFVLIPAILLAATIKRNEVWKSGIALWSDVVEKSPMRLRGYNNLGNEYSRAGMQSEAIKAYKAGIRAAEKARPQPLHLSELHYNLGIEHDAAGDRNSAAQHYTEAAAINPANSDALNNLGIIHMDRGELALAAATFSRAMAASPANLAARFNLGETYIMQYERGGAKDAGLLRSAYPLIKAYADAHPDYEPARQYMRMIEGVAGGG